MCGIALKIYCEKFSPRIAVRTSMSDYKKEVWLANLPLYAVGCLPPCSRFQAESCQKAYKTIFFDAPADTAGIFLAHPAKLHQNSARRGNRRIRGG